jgi:hypothetical protein
VSDQTGSDIEWVACMSAILIVVAVVFLAGFWYVGFRL